MADPALAAHGSPLYGGVADYGGADYVSDASDDFGNVIGFGRTPRMDAAHVVILLALTLGGVILLDMAGFRGMIAVGR